MLYAAVIYTVSRRRRRSPRRFVNTPPLWRLLLGEAAEGARRLVRKWRLPAVLRVNGRSCRPAVGA